MRLSNGKVIHRPKAIYGLAYAPKIEQAYRGKDHPPKFTGRFDYPGPRNVGASTDVTEPPVALEMNIFYILSASLADLRNICYRTPQSCYQSRHANCFKGSIQNLAIA